LKLIEFHHFLQRERKKEFRSCLEFLWVIEKEKYFFLLFFWDIYSLLVVEGIFKQQEIFK